MLWFYAPQIYPSDIDKGQTRVGACFQVENAEYIICFDGRCGNAASRAIKRLNQRKKRKILFLSTVQMLMNKVILIILQF